MILYVGYLWTRKGLIDLIEAFGAVHTELPETHLVICGAGGEESKIKSAAARSSVSDAIQFVGDVEPHRIHRYMQASDLFVLPSHSEGMPNAVMEAMACGLPTVCTSVGGLTAALSKTEGAVLVPPMDSKSLAAALQAVIADPAKRRRMGGEARKLAEEQFGVRQNAQRILDFLANVIRTKEVSL